jgi:hypothetical protein
MSKTRDENVVETTIVGNTEFRLVVEQDDDPMNPWEDGVFDTLGTLVTWHRRLCIGHEQPKIEAHEWLLDLAGVDEDSYHAWWSARVRGIRDKPGRMGETFAEALQAKIDRELDKLGIVILPVYAYEHGGVTISTGSFNCPWDSGQLGYIYATKDKILESLGREKGRRLGPKDKAKAREIMESEIKVFDQYLTGDVWCWEIESRSVSALEAQTSEDEQDDEDFNPSEWSMRESCYGCYGYDYTATEGKRELEFYKNNEGKL